MYYEPQNWHEVKKNEIVHIMGGVVHVKCNKQADVYIVDVEDAKNSDKRWLVGSGLEIRAKVAGDVYVLVEHSGRAWYYDVVSPIYLDEGEKYLNADRMPVYGDEYEGSMRLKRLKEMAELRTMAAEREKLRRQEAELYRKKKEEQEAAELQKRLDEQNKKLREVASSDKEEEDNQKE